MSRYMQKEFTIGGVKVHFPCKPYPSQFSMMDRILRSLDRSQNCLLESPTGSGKTLALLCSALAWQGVETEKREREEAACETSPKDCNCACHTALPVLKDQADPPKIQSPTPASASSLTPLTTPTHAKSADAASAPDLEDADSDFRPSSKVYRAPVASSQVSQSATEGLSAATATAAFDVNSYGIGREMRKRRPVEIQYEESPDSPLFEEEEESKEETKPVLECAPCTCNCASKPSKKSSKVPCVYFGTRTHKQVAQIAKELRKTAYHNVRMTILGSREHTCIHPEVSKMSHKAELCKDLIDNHQCKFYERHKRYGSHLALAQFGLDSAWDLEDLASYGKTHKACPYFMSRQLRETAQLVICPYNYLVDPLIREAMEINLKGQIVILDEAHNIEDCSREAASQTVSQDSLQTAMQDLVQMIDNNMRIVECSRMRQMCQHLSDFIDKQSTKLDQKDFEQSCKIWNGYDIVAQLDSLNLGPKHFPEIKNAFQKATAPDEEERQDSLLTIGTKTTLEKIILVLNNLYKQDMQFVDDYRLSILRSIEYKVNQNSSGQWLSSRKRHGGLPRQPVETFTMNFWCMNPAVTFGDFASCRTVVLSSGTLSPLTSFQSELGMQFPIQLEAQHVINDEQVWVGCLGQGPTGHQLQAVYRNVETFAFQDELGKVLLQTCKSVPHGVLCFLPSYKVLEKLSDRWKTTGLWQEILACKKIVAEPRASDKMDFEELMKFFYDVINQSSDQSSQNGKSGEGAFFLAVCRGKVSEGLDFADNFARAVITVGIPFPNFKDIQVELKRKYNDEHRFGRGLLSGSDWYEVQAFRALNQALGRCIRHRKDWGALILIDDRFVKHSARYCKNLSKWVRSKLQTFPSCQKAMESLAAFTKERQIEQANDDDDVTFISVETSQKKTTQGSLSPAGEKPTSAAATDGAKSCSPVPDKQNLTPVIPSTPKAPSSKVQGSAAHSKGQGSAALSKGQGSAALHSKGQGSAAHSKGQGSAALHSKGQGSAASPVSAVKRRASESGKAQSAPKKVALQSDSKPTPKSTAAMLPPSAKPASGKAGVSGTMVQLPVSKNQVVLIPINSPQAAQLQARAAVAGAAARPGLQFLQAPMSSLRAMGVPARPPLPVSPQGTYQIVGSLASSIARSVQPLNTFVSPTGQLTSAPTMLQAAPTPQQFLVGGTRFQVIYPTGVSAASPGVVPLPGAVPSAMTLIPNKVGAYTVMGVPASAATKTPQLPRLQIKSEGTSSSISTTSISTTSISTTASIAASNVTTSGAVASSGATSTITASSSTATTVTSAAATVCSSTATASGASSISSASAAASAPGLAASTPSSTSIRTSAGSSTNRSKPLTSSASSTVAAAKTTSVDSVKTTPSTVSKAATAVSASVSTAAKVGSSSTASTTSSQGMPVQQQTSLLYLKDKAYMISHAPGQKTTLCIVKSPTKTSSASKPSLTAVTSMALAAGKASIAGSQQPSILVASSKAQGASILRVVSGPKTEGKGAGDAKSPEILLAGGFPSSQNLVSLLPMKRATVSSSLAQIIPGATLFTTSSSSKSRVSSVAQSGVKVEPGTSPSSCAGKVKVAEPANAFFKFVSVSKSESKTPACEAITAGQGGKSKDKSRKHRKASASDLEMKVKRSEEVKVKADSRAAVVSDSGDAASKDALSADRLALPGSRAETPRSHSAKSTKRKHTSSPQKDATPSESSSDVRVTRASRKRTSLAASDLEESEGVAMRAKKPLFSRTSLTALASGQSEGHKSDMVMSSFPAKDEEVKEEQMQTKETSEEAAEVGDSSKAEKGQECRGDVEEEEVLITHRTKKRSFRKNRLSMHKAKSVSKLELQDLPEIASKTIKSEGQKFVRCRGCEKNLVSFSDHDLRMFKCVSCVQELLPTKEPVDCLVLTSWELLGAQSWVTEPLADCKWLEEARTAVQFLRCQICEQSPGFKVLLADKNSFELHTGQLWLFMDRVCLPEEESESAASKTSE